MEWGTEQQAAIEMVTEWHAKRDTPVFKLFGYAGSGKTTLAKHLAGVIGGRVLFAAYTGKAAHVLQQKGCDAASTIHRLIYTPKNKSKADLIELERRHSELSQAVPPDQKLLDSLWAQIQEQRAKHRRPAFELNPESEVKGASAICIDEVSMVGMQMGADLLSFGVPILVLGDPAQLPPVADGGYFTRGLPDFMLTQVHRQAAGSPIYALCTLAREGRRLPLGEHGSSRVLAAGHFRGRIEEALEFDQIIVGRNKTRKYVNRKLREASGRAGLLPETGDRLVCLRNDHDMGLLNGSQWTVISSEAVDEDIILLEIQAHGEKEATPFSVTAHRGPFEDREVPFWDLDDAQHFDYAYAMTCHKSQGSQWGSVLVFDESGSFPEYSDRWLYTAITRAADRVCIVGT